MNHRHSSARPSAVAAALFAAAAAAFAQPPATGFAERVDVELVTVDVWVTDAAGNPVTGLAAADFEVQHDGRPVAVTHFTEMRAGRVAEPVTPGAATTEAGGTPEVAGSSPAHVVVYFDQSRLHPTRYPALIRSLREFLNGESVPAGRVLLLRQDRSLSVEAPFGSTTAELAAALDRLAKGTASGIDIESETRLAIDAIRDVWEESQDAVGSASAGLAAVPSAGGQPGEPGGGASSVGGPRAVVGGVGSGAGPDACGMFANQIQPILDSWTRSNSQRVAVTLTNLSSTASFLAGLPGVKTLLYLSDGLETQPGAELATYASSLCPAAGSDLLTGTLAQQMSSAFLDLTRHANTNRVTIYSLQTSGLRSPGTGDATAGRSERGRGGGARARGAFEASKRAGEREGLGMLAGETGGRAVFNQNDLLPELEKIADDLGHYYSLAYQPPAGGDEQRDHRIEVKVAGGDRTARYRRGYLEKSPSQWLSERIEGALNLGLTSNALEVRLGAGEITQTESSSYRLPLHVMVPVERLAFLPQGDAYLAEVLVRVMVRQVDGNTLMTDEKSYRVQGSPQATGFADLAIALELAAGTHLTGIGVVDQNTREASFVSTTLQVGPDS